MLVLALAAVAALAIKGRLGVGSAAIAVVGLRQLSTQLSGVEEYSPRCCRESRSCATSKIFAPEFRPRST